MTCLLERKHQPYYLINPGKVFEADFKESAEKANIFVYRLKDCAGWRGQDEDCSSTRFTPSNSFDFILYQDGTFYALELKSLGGTSFSFSSLRNEKGPQKQVRDLLDASNYEGLVAIEPHVATVFHAKADEVDWDQCYNSYVKYGKDLESLIG